MSTKDTQPSNQKSDKGHESAPPLGSITKSPSAPAAFSDRIARYALQSAARELHPDGRIRNCMRALAPTRDCVEIWHNDTHSRSFYRGLIRCNQIWVCPLCASWITERRRSALSVLLSQRVKIPVADGSPDWGQVYAPMWYVGLATFTISHRAGESLADVKRRLDTAYAYQFAGRWGVAWRRSHRVIGTIRSLEITHGENGWHPHYHTLMVRNTANTQSSMAAIELELTTRWGHAVHAARATASAERGVTFAGWDVGSVAYLTKIGQEIVQAARRWDVVAELTKAPAKRGRSKGRTTWELLADYMTGDVRAGELWIEAARTLKGARHLVASPGLYNRLGATIDLDTDNATAEQQITQSDRLLASLTGDEWRVILNKNMRAELLDVADNGDEQMLRDWIGEIIG